MQAVLPLAAGGRLFKNVGLGVPRTLADGEPLLADGLVGQIAGVTGIVAAGAGQRPAVQAAACDLGLVKMTLRIQHNGFGTALAAALDAVSLAVVEDVPLTTQPDKAAVGVAIGGLGRGVTVPSDVCIGNEDSAVPVAGQRLVGDSIAQVVALLRGIHKVIPFADFSGEKRLRRSRGPQSRCQRWPDSRAAPQKARP